ncbi:hypothetical protein [Nitratireductor alexandrii]|uniref:hypothetical protein n=1 Tax=Nitratireductor alexandrii TaxID=2448161 RepID=UPI000FD90341|nr:hypothetical protein [Nitratireductor alexandrii]
MTKRNSRHGKSPAPISLRVTPEERQALVTAAKGQTLSAYIRTRLFSDSAQGIRETGRLSESARQQLLARILAELGRSALSRSMAEFAEAARLGVLPLTPEVLAEIRSARDHIRDLRRMLIRALGLQAED